MRFLLVAPGYQKINPQLPSHIVARNLLHCDFVSFALFPLHLRLPPSLSQAHSSDSPPTAHSLRVRHHLFSLAYSPPPPIPSAATPLCSLTRSPSQWPCCLTLPPSLLSLHLQPPRGPHTLPHSFLLLLGHFPPLLRVAPHELFTCEFQGGILLRFLTVYCS